MKKEINIVIAGSREFIDYEFLTKVLDDVVSRLRKKDYETITIVSGKARGADSLGEKYARAHSLPVIECPADWDGLGKSAGYVRNEEMAKLAKLVIAFWNGKSRGTKHMIDLARKYRKIVLIYRY